MSNYISFTPFGRGSSAATTDLSSPYTALRTLLNTTKLDSSNLSPRAGFPESWVDWESDPPTGQPDPGGHRHQGVPLGPGSIGMLQLDTTKTAVGDDANGCALAFTQTPGVLCLFGMTNSITVTNSSPSVEVEVKYVNASAARSTFLTGTFPLVFITPYRAMSSAPTEAFPCQIVVTSATSTGFICTVVKDPDGPSTSVTSVQLMWIAIGAAPGIVTPPTEIL